MKLMQDMRATGRKLYGDDFDAVLTKHASFGDDCCEILIYGKHHREAAIKLGCLGSEVTILQGRNSRNGTTYEYAALTMPLK